MLMIFLMVKLLKFKLNFILMKSFSIMIFLMVMKLYCIESMWSWFFYLMGIDKFSYLLIILMMWLMKCMMITSSLIYKKKIYLENFNFLMMIMMIFLMMTFLVLNMLIFYIFFETSMIPVFLLILGWGYQPERLRAGMYMMLYTLTSSMPLLMMIYLIYLENYELSMVVLLMNESLKIEGVLYFMMMMMVFFVKTPVVLLHLWLPKAHVEAPISGSMILAGIMLKLGTYGMLRVQFYMEKELSKIYGWILMISMIGGIYMSMISLIQIDLKMLVAYSSVVHMSMLVMGLLTMMSWGYLGGYLMMIGHGLCSSGLFVLVNINYERVESRNLLLNKGFMNVSPKLTLWWFLMCSSNMGAPPSLNLMSEIMMLMSLIYWSKSVLYYLVTLMFISTLYNLYLYSYSQHGDFNLNKFTIFISVKMNEYLMVMMHWIPLNLMIFKIKNYM